MLEVPLAHGGAPCCPAIIADTSGMSAFATRKKPKRYNDGSLGSLSKQPTPEPYRGPQLTMTGGTTR